MASTRFGRCVVFACLVVVAQGHVEFEAWKRSEGRSYGGADEEKARRVYAQNRAVVDALNSDADDGAVYALNRFGDADAAGFAAKWLMPKRSAPKFPPERYAVASSRANSNAFDWRDFNATTPVQDQGALGSCWAFSATQNVEGQRFLRDGLLEALSVEQILECDAGVDEAQSRADCGEFGGWPYLALGYVIKAGGLRTAAEMPYCAGVGYGQKGNCMPCMPDGYSPEQCGQHAAEDDDDGPAPLFCDKNTTLG